LDYLSSTLFVIVSRRRHPLYIAVGQLRSQSSIVIIVIVCRRRLLLVIARLLYCRHVNWIGTTFNYFRLSPRCTVV